MYNRTKVKLLNNISSIKPSIYKKNKITESNLNNNTDETEITSITDFIELIYMKILDEDFKNIS